MNILIATHNKNKIMEFNKLMKSLNVNIITLEQLNDNNIVVENGSSFYENAYIKAKYYANKYQMITLADDSGICVEALNGEPGINSARYNRKTNLSNNDLLLKNMYNISNRSATFICSLVIYLPNKKSFHYEGKINGLITNSKRGNKGFGYDAIFYIKKYKKTFAQIDTQLKNKISHRAIAFRKGREKLHEIINNK